MREHNVVKRKIIQSNGKESLTTEKVSNAWRFY